MDSSIILAGQPVNPLAALSAGMETGARRNELARQAEYNAMLKANGGGLLSGDQNALAALAGYDPQAATALKAQQQSMGIQRQEMEMRLRAEQRQVEEFARTASAQEKAAMAAQIEGAVKMGLAIQTPQEWDALMAQQAPHLVGAFDQRQALAMSYMSMAEALKAATPETIDPTKGAPTGYMFTDPRNPAAGVTPLPGYTKAPGVVVNTGPTGEPVPQIGSVPQGFAAVPDPNSPAGYRMERIPGGPEDTSKADAAAASSQSQAASIVLGKINDLKALVAGASVVNPATGFGAQTAAGYGGTNAANARALIDTIEANVAFDALSAMRAASPTGGALGAISERELTLLGATLSSLSQAQTPDQFLRSLSELESIYSGIMQKAAAYPNAAQFGFGPGGAPAAPSAPAAPTSPAQMSDDELLRFYGAP